MLSASLNKTFLSLSRYIDDVVIYSDTFEHDMKQIHQFFERVSMANLIVNLVNSEFCHATVEYVGYIVGQGQLKPGGKRPVTHVTNDIQDFVKFCIKQLGRSRPSTRQHAILVDYILF